MDLHKTSKSLPLKVSYLFSRKSIAKKVLSKMATANQPFKELNSALENLFRNYDELQGALESLSENVISLALDARDQTVKINVLGRTTCHNLNMYLESLQKMSKAILEKDFKTCERQAGTAQFAMKKGLHSQVGAENTDEMLTAVESVVEILRGREQTNGQQSAADMDEVIQKATNGASSIIKDVTLRLLHYIKEEIKKALDDSTLIRITSSALDEGVRNVKQTVEKVNSSYSENISALDSIISMINELSCKEVDENTLRSLEANAKTLGETCEAKLKSLEESDTK